MKYISATILLVLVGCGLGLGKPSITGDDPTWDVSAVGPANASPGDIIIYDATASNADSITWAAFIVSGNATQIEIVPIENNKKVIVPPKIGEIYLTVAGCKGGVVKLKTYRTTVAGEYSPPGPGPGPRPEVEPAFTKYIKTQLAFVQSPDKATEKNLLRNNIETVLKQTFAEPADFTDALKELNRNTLSASMKTNWSGFMQNVKTQLESLNLKTMEDHIRVYKEFSKGLQ